MKFYPHFPIIVETDFNYIIRVESVFFHETGYVKCVVYK